MPHVEDWFFVSAEPAVRSKWAFPRRTFMFTREPWVTGSLIEEKRSVDEVMAAANAGGFECVYCSRFTGWFNRGILDLIDRRVFQKIAEGADPPMEWPRDKFEISIEVEARMRKHHT